MLMDKRLSSPPQNSITRTSDSNCGSLVTQSSSSGLSLLSDSDFLDEPSTSGCSSEMASNMQSREKKRKVKEYLRELQSMMPETSGSKPGTLGTLYHVVINMRKIAEEKKQDRSPVPNVSSSEPAALPSLQCPEFVDFRNVNDGIDLNTESELAMAVSVKNHVVLHASSALKDLLGYPQAWWKRRLLRDFVHKKDIMTVNSYISSETTDASSADFRTRIETKDSLKQQKQFFFARIRRFRSLSSSFGLSSTGSYIFFKVIVTAKPPEPITDLATEEQKIPKHYIMLYFAPMLSPYKDGQLPEDQEQRVFSLRHSPFCTYTYTHANTIPLLGFLPQEIVGTSVFDYYHPDDLPQLLDIYKKATFSMGQPFKSGLLRLRTRNGTYVTVTTEWSSFMNPWDYKLEFIIAKHTVVRVPENPNVFEEGPEEPKSADSRLTDASRSLIQKITEVLRKPMGMDARPLTPSDSWEAGGSSQPAGTRNVDKDKGKDENSQEQASSSDVSSSNMDGKSISSLYRQVNYSLNIKKYLMSHPKTFPVSDEDSSTDVGQKDDSEEDTNEEVEMQVEIPVCQPQSCGSSAQVHVSEQGIHEEGPSSPTSFNGEDPNVVQESIDSHMVLTEDSLRKHTKAQELLYLQETSKEQPHLFHMKSRRQSRQRSRQKRNRPSGFDETSSKYKFSRNAKGQRGSGNNSMTNLFMSNVPISAVDITPTNSQSVGSGRTEPVPNMMGVMAGPYQFGMGLTMLPINPASGLPHLPSVLPPPGSNIHWPYYPQPGYSMMPQVMTGFYQPVPMTNVSQDPLACEQSLGTSSGNEQQTSSPEEQQKNGTDSDNPSHTEDSGSSTQYLLDALSGSISSPTEETDDKTRQKEQPQPSKSVPRRTTVPPWLQTVNWTPEMRLSYQLPVQTLRAVLKRDEKALEKMEQSEQVKAQLEALLKEVESPDHEPALNEEADYIFYPELFSSETANSGSEVEGENTLPKSCTSAVACGKGHASLKEPTTTVSSEGVHNGVSDRIKADRKGLKEPVQITISEESPERVLDEMQTEIPQSPEKAKIPSEMVSDLKLKTVEATESIAASDAPSHDCGKKDAEICRESGLSSVNSFSALGDTKQSSGSVTNLTADTVDKLFVPLKVWMYNGNVLNQPNKVMALPFWQQDACMTDNVIMRYNLEPQDTSTVLASDHRRLTSMPQPQKVSCQLLELLQKSQTAINKYSETSKCEHVSENHHQEAEESAEKSAEITSSSQHVQDSSLSANSPVQPKDVLVPFKDNSQCNPVEEGPVPSTASIDIQLRDRLQNLTTGQASKDWPGDVIMKEVFLPFNLIGAQASAEKNRAQDTKILDDGD